MFISSNCLVEISWRKVIQPPILSVAQGKKARFRCFTNEDLKVTWTFNKTELPNNTLTGKILGKIYVNWLLINNVQIKNAGTYSCSVEKNYLESISDAQLIVNCKY